MDNWRARLIMHKRKIFEILRLLHGISKTEGGGCGAAEPEEVFENHGSGVHLKVARQGRGQLW